MIEVTLLGQTVNHYRYAHGVAVTIGGAEALGRTDIGRIAVVLWIIWYTLKANGVEIPLPK